MRIQLSFLYFCFACLSFISCSDDNKPNNPEDQTITRWIEEYMRSNYYWYKDMPDADRLDFNSEPEVFFEFLLSSEDGKTNSRGRHYYYSTISDLSSESTRSIQQTERSYGINFLVYLNADNTGYAHVLYVAPGSPAHAANLKRGDWILKINGAKITGENYILLLGSDACILTTGYWDPTQRDFVEQPDEVSIEAARQIEDDPVHHYEVIPHNGKKIGYLVYNHFTAGKTDNDQSYDDKLREVSNIFNSEAIDEFVLDLRYNGGGLLSSAQVLCSILAPRSVLGGSLGYLEYNDKQSPRNYNIPVTTTHLGAGSNLDLNRLYVLVSNSSASASEFIINSLKPYMDVVIIGTQTEGKNVGSQSQKSSDGQWEISPITCKIYNSDGDSDYNNGFTPDVPVDEATWDNLTTWDYFLAFGDKDELLLGTALSLIDGSYISSSVRSGSTGSAMKIVYSSLERRATNGVVIN